MEEQRRAEEEAQSRARAEAAERELRERLAQEAARAEEERRLAEQHRAQQEAERVAKQEADRRAEAERRAKEQAAKEAHALLERTRAQERLAAEQREAEHRAASSLAAVQLQRVVRGNIVRTRLRKARERAAFVDDDEYDYGGVDEDFLPDISGLDFSSELLMPKPCSPARPRSSNSGHRIVIDTTAMAPRGAPSPRGSLMVLPEEGPPIPGPPHPPAAWGEQAWQAAVVHEEEQAVHEPLTHRSEVSEVGSVSSTGSRVASRLREAISDWGFQDPNVARTFAARRRKMAKQQRDATRRRDEKDPAKRLEKFRHNQGALSKANGTQAKPAWMQPPPDHDDDNMSVHSFATEEIPATPDLSFHSAAPNRKLVRSQGEVAEARRGRVVPTQHVVLSNNFLPGSR